MNDHRCWLLKPAAGGEALAGESTVQTRASRDAEQEVRASVTHNTRDHRCPGIPRNGPLALLSSWDDNPPMATWWSRKNPPETMRGQRIGPKGERIPSTRDSNASCPLPRQEPRRPQGHNLGRKGFSYGIDHAGNSAMNRAEIIAELEAMVSTRLFSCRPWLADRETFSAVTRKLVQMGLLEHVSVEPLSWRITPLGKELDVELFWMFMGWHDR